MCFINKDLDLHQNNFQSYLAGSITTSVLLIVFLRTLMSYFSKMIRNVLLHYKLVYLHNCNN